MTNEMIDKYLGQQGITPGPWKTKHKYEDSTIIGCDGSMKHSYRQVAEIDDKKNVRVLKNSRKSLRDWIMVAWESVTDKNTFEIENIYKLATENIEASLGKPWEQVRAELEVL